jgi:hypothetical protein
MMYTGRRKPERINIVDRIVVDIRIYVGSVTFPDRVSGEPSSGGRVVISVAVAAGGPAGPDGPMGAGEVIGGDGFASGR